MDMGLLITAFGSLLLGIINCFFGYALYRSLIWVYGFLLGFLFGAAAVVSVNREAAQMAPGVVIAFGLGFGFFNAWLSASLYALPVVLMGAATGIYLVGRFVHISDEDFQLLATVIAAFIGGLIAYALRRYVIIAWTAVVGALLIINGMLLFVPNVATAAIIKRGEFFLSPSLQLTPGLTALCFVFFFALSIGGIVFQYWNTKEQAYSENKRGY